MLRVRDLVHGDVLLTETEMTVINHPLFQRLRHIRQNDVAFYVYPSLNVSRFEHLLGACRAAGRMAENVTLSPKWKTYLRELKRTAGVSSADEFVAVTRLYALLHDIGHFPLSHLFEFALKSYAPSQGRSYGDVVKEWSGIDGFEELHEAFGALLIARILEDIAFPKPLREVLYRLMTEKAVSLGDMLFPIKALIDSDIDADRTDFVRRDGLLAGGEYGNYDIGRLCSSVFVERDRRGWFIAYSEKALTSMEALLLDRYRVYLWVHFHHRVVAMKMLVRFLIEKALRDGIITRGDFDPANQNMLALRDDVWLWNVLRGIDPQGNATFEMVKRAVFYREKKNVLNLWKSRTAYHSLNDKVKERARVTDVTEFDFGFPGMYESEVGKAMGIQVLRSWLSFEPIGDEKVLLYSESERKLTGRDLYGVSRLVAHLPEVWKGEPRYYVLLIGENAAQERARLEPEWITLTGDWIRK